MNKKLIHMVFGAILGASTGTANALTITWLDGPGAGNNTPFSTGPGLVTPSTINSTPFTATPTFPSPPNPRNSEFRLVDPTGNVGGGGEKSVIEGVGDETWTFDNGLLTLTGSDFPGNPGAFAGAAPLADTNPTLLRTAPFFGVDMVPLAPTTTSLAGTAYGAASLNMGSGDDFSILFPAFELQWAGTYFPLGLDDGGVTFYCTGALSGNVHCAAEHTFDISDDPGIAGFNGWTAQWDLYGTLDPSAPRVRVDINVDGNRIQECSSHEGNTVLMTAVSTTTGGAVVESVSWDIDGDFFATGESITPTLELGTHLVTVNVTTDAGAMDSDTATIIIEDKTRPLLVAAFRDVRTGDLITSVMDERRQFVEISLLADDVCDPAPQITSARLIPSYMTSHGEVLKIKPVSGKVNLPVSALSLDAFAKDAANNGASASAMLEIIRGR